MAFVLNLTTSHYDKNLRPALIVIQFYAIYLGGGLATFYKSLVLTNLMTSIFSLESKVWLSEVRL